MSDAIRILVTVDSTVDPELVETVLSIEPDVQIMGMSETLDKLWEGAADDAADLVVVACDGYSDRVLSYIDAEVKQRPERPVVVLSSTPPNGFVRRLFQAGAEDILSLPDAYLDGNGAAAEQIVFALQKALARRRGAAPPVRTALGSMICVLGPKGGIGKTLTTSNLGVALARDGHDVVIVDLDLQFGDVALALGIAPERTIYDLALSSGTLDAEKMDAYLATHESGLRILLAPTRPDQASSIGVEFLREVYSVLRSSFDYVLVDTPPGFTPEVIASIDSSTAICMVGMLDSLSLKNTKLGLETLDLMGYDPDRVQLVLNRADSRVGITRDDVTRIVGRPPDVLVPSHRDIARHVNAGRPVVLASRRSEAAKAFSSLAALYAGAKAGARRSAKRNGRHLLKRGR
jgi:pilus assembly protein CpaE